MTMLFPHLILFVTSYYTLRNGMFAGRRQDLNSPFSNSLSATMARLRRDAQDTLPNAYQKPLRVVACGTLFLTHTLALSSHPEPSSVVRARSVIRTRGGSASTCMSIVAQFPHVEAMLVAPLGGNEEGKMIIQDLERERVSTRYCKVWDGSGVPSAWVLHAGMSNPPLNMFQGLPPLGGRACCVICSE